MLIKNVTQSNLEEALRLVNKLYDNNIEWNGFSSGYGYGEYRVTLRVKDSKGAGHRISHSGRRMISACWHVHGDFFDALLKINPNAVIKTRVAEETLTIDKDGGNWQDRDIGSAVKPLMFSEACGCGLDPLEEKEYRESLRDAELL